MFETVLNRPWQKMFYWIELSTTLFPIETSVETLFACLLMMKDARNSRQASSVVKLNQSACRQEVQILELHVETSMSDGNVMERIPIDEQGTSRMQRKMTCRLDLACTKRWPDDVSRYPGVS